jgi:hypothetical protein
MTPYVFNDLIRRIKTESSAKVRFHASALVALFALVSAVLGGCAGRGSVQDNPSAQQKFVFASAYSAAACQAKMNDLAGADVQVVEDNQQVTMSILSLGIVPSDRCIGVAKVSALVAPVSAKHD